MTHTPGPWRVGGDGTIIYAPDGFAVANATVFHGRHPGAAPANARLIAAAPDMLAELERLAEAFGWPADHPARIIIAAARGKE